MSLKITNEHWLKNNIGFYEVYDSHNRKVIFKGSPLTAEAYFSALKENKTLGWYVLSNHEGETLDDTEWYEFDLVLKAAIETYSYTLVCSHTKEFIRGLFEKEPEPLFNKDSGLPMLSGKSNRQYKREFFERYALNPLDYCDGLETYDYFVFKSPDTFLMFICDVIKHLCEDVDIEIKTKSEIKGFVW